MKQTFTKLFLLIVMMVGCTAPAFSGTFVPGDEDSYAYPTPVKVTTGFVTIAFKSTATECELTVFDKSGEITFRSDKKPALDDITAGYKSVIWNLITSNNTAVSYGVYFYHIKADGKDYYGKIAVTY